MDFIDNGDYVEGASRRSSRIKTLRRRGVNVNYADVLAKAGLGSGSSSSEFDASEPSDSGDDDFNSGNSASEKDIDSSASDGDSGDKKTKGVSKKGTSGKKVKPKCEYGANCYRKSTAHLKQFRH